MKKTLAIASMALLTTVFGAQGNGKAKGHAKTNDPYTAKPLPKGAQHPMTDPNGIGNGARTTDRDFGRERAAEVGKGKKKGLYKTNNGRSRTNR